MSEQDPTQGRLERWLRRWGADEAARRAAVEPFHIPAPVRGRPLLVFVTGRVALAAAAVVLAVAVVILAVSEFGPRRTSPADGALHAPALTPAEAGRVHPNEVARLQAKWDAERAGLRAEIDRQAADLKKALDEKQKQFDVAFAARDAEARKLADDLKERDAELAARAAALASAQQANQKLLAELKEKAGLLPPAAGADAGAAALRARQGVTDGLLRRLYLASSAPGQKGLRAVQAAARQNRLLPRCADLGVGARSRAARNVLDLAEVLLTRLDLLDPDNSDAAEALRAAVQRAALDAPIADAFQSKDVAPALKEWLLEAQIVLSGV